MKRKKKKPPKIRKKRNKKYKGAEAQSKADLAKRNYQPAIDFISGYNSNIHNLSNQLDFLTAPTYQDSIFSAWNGVQEQLSAFNHFKNLLPQNKLHSTAFDLAREATLAYTRFSSPSTIDHWAKLAETKSWYQETPFRVSPISEIARASSDVAKLASHAKSVSDIFGAKNISSLGLQSAFGKATELSLFAEKSLSTFTLNDIGSRIGLQKSARESITENFLKVSQDYSGLLKSFDTNPNSLIELSPSLIESVPKEFYSGANLLESISADEQKTSEEELLKNDIQYENEYSLHKYLPLINAGLYSIWKGAIETFNSNNSDKVRQFTASLRELFTHVMHLLSPDEEIRKWTTDPSYFDKGKPIRKARLHYIYRHISNNSFNKFSEQNIKATLEFISIFQEGTHAIDSGFTPAQLIAMKSKAETTLKFLLEIEFSVNRRINS